MNSVPGCSNSVKFRVVLHRNQEGFEELARPLVVGKQVIGVTAFGARKRRRLLRRGTRAWVHPGELYCSPIKSPPGWRRASTPLQPGQKTCGVASPHALSVACFDPEEYSV